MDRFWVRLAGAGRVACRLGLGLGLGSGLGLVIGFGLGSQEQDVLSAPAPAQDMLPARCGYEESPAPQGLGCRDTGMIQGEDVRAATLEISLGLRV